MAAPPSLRRQVTRQRGRQWLLAVMVAGAVAGAIGFLVTGAATRVLRATGITPVAGIACPSANPASPAACPLGTRVVAPGPSSTRSLASPGPWPSPGQTGVHSDASAATRVPLVPGPQSAVRKVLRLINRARATAGLPRYTRTAALDRSAARHDSLMASGCGLAQQCPGELPLGARETAAGVAWTIAGENTGEGGPAANSVQAITQFATAVTQDMLNEKPPSDGHLRNILSSSFHHIGIAIYWSSSGTVWITEDFSS